jgi:hypothetical protein
MAAGAYISGIGSWLTPVGIIIAAVGGLMGFVDDTFCGDHGDAINFPVIGPDNIGC